MKDFVAAYRIGIVSLAASVAAISIILVSQGFALKGFAWGTLALSVGALAIAVGAGRSSTSSMWDVLHGVDDESRSAVAVRTSAPTERNK